MKLTGKTTKAIRKLTGFRVIELPERNGSLNDLLCSESDDVGDFWPLRVGQVIEDVVGLVRLDLYLYRSNGGGLAGNKTVWIFDDGKTQRVYGREADVPGELARAVAIAANAK